MAPGCPLGVNTSIHSYCVRRRRCSSRHRERVVHGRCISQPPGGVPNRRRVPSRRRAPHPVREAPGPAFCPKWAIRVVAEQVALTAPNVVSGRFQRVPTFRECVINAHHLGSVAANPGNTGFRIWGCISRITSHFFPCGSRTTRQNLFFSQQICIFVVQ